MAEESLRLQQTAYPDEGSSLSSLRETKSLLQALAGGDGETEAFSAFEWDSDGGYSVHTNYRSSNDTPDGPEDEESDTLPTSEPELTELEALDRQRANQPLTPKEEEERLPTLKEEEERPLTPPARVPTLDDEMSFQYPKYREDLDVEAHAYAFMQTWEANHVSQRLNVAEAE